MGLQAIYPKPRTTVINKAEYKYPYLLKNLEINKPNQVWAVDIIPFPTPN
jgi:putative transposase